jgi:hypothetical protein
MALVFSIKEQASIELEYLDADGNVAPIDGIPSWTIVSGDVSIVPSEDGLSAKIKSNGVPTTFEVLAKGDADLDADEERFLEATILGVVEAVEAVSVGFKATVEPLS